VPFSGRRTASMSTAVAGLDWSTAALLSDEELESRLYPPIELVAAERPAVDWAAVHTELKRKGVTLSLLWEEYRPARPQRVHLPGV